MSITSRTDLLNTPFSVVVELADIKNFFACWREHKCSTCGEKLSSYSSKYVNLLDGKINCGHEEAIGRYLPDSKHITDTCWIRYSDG